MADGSIIIDTLLRIDGYMKNMKKLHASQTKLKGQIEETTSKIDRLEKEINDLNTSEVSSAKMDKLKEQIASCDKEINDLNKSKVSSPKMEKLNEQIASCNKEVWDLQEQMLKLEATQVPTQEFNELQKFITATEDKLNKLLDRESKMSDMGKRRTSGWKSLQYDIEETRKSLAYAKGEMEDLKSSGGAYTSGANTVEYKKLYAKALQIDKKSMQYNAALNTTKAEEYEKLRAKISQITKKRQEYNVALDVTRAKENQAKDTKIQKKRIEQEKLNRTLEAQNAKYEEIDGRINAVSNSFSRLGAAARKNMGSRITKATESCRRGINKLNQSISRFMKRLLNVGLTVFVFSVLTRAMTALKDRIGLLLKKNQQFSSSLAQVRGNLKTAFQSIYEAALPALNSLMSVLAKVTAVIASFTAALFGKSVKASQEAAKAADSQTEAVSGVGEAAKKASEYLNGYDEMNVQPSKDSSGGGGGGSSTGTTYEDIDVNGGVSDFVNRIKAAWETADFTDIGRTIGVKIRDGLNGINWESIKTTASKVGTSAATLLNGVFETPGLFASVGSTVAEALNTALNGLYSFGKDFHWDSLGKGLSESVNTFFKTFEFDKLGQTVHDWIAGGLTAATTFLKETDFEVIGNRIAEFLTTLDVADLSDKFADLFWEAIKAGAGLVKGLFEEAPVEASLITAFAVLKFTGLGSAIATKIGSAIVTAITGSSFGTAVSGAVSTIGTTLVTAFTTDLPLLFGAGTFAECAAAIFGGLVGAIAAAIGGWKLGNWLYENNVFSVGDTIDKIVENSGLGDLAVKIADFFEFDFPEFTVDIKGKIDESFTKAKEDFDSLQDSEALKTLKQFGKDSIDGAKAVWEAIKTEGVTKTLSQVGKDDIDKAKDSWIAIKTEDALKTLKEKGKKDIEKAKKVWNSIKTSTRTLKLKAKDSAGSVVDRFKKKWDKLKDKTLSIKGNIQANVDNIKSFINTKIIGKINTNVIGTLNTYLPGKIKIKPITPLANGGVIPPNAPFLAMLGDQTRGTNIETPLNTMIEAFTAALDARNDSGNEPVINVYVGGQKITDFVIKDVKNRTISSGGKNPLLI